MMQLTEEQRKALIVSLERRIKNAKRWLSSNKSIGNHEGEAIELISIYEIALAALTAKEEPCEYCGGSGIAEEPSDDGLGCGCCACCGTGKSGLYKAPPVAALRLPDVVLIHSEMDFVRKEKAKEFNRCISEIKRLNATAPEEKQND